MILCCCVLLIQPYSGWAKPGGEYSYGDYGTSEIGGAYQTLPDASSYLSTTDLKSASTYDIGYGAPIGEPVPTAAIFPIRSFGGWGWKQPFPQPVVAPVPIYAKPVPYPIATIPVGWGWQGPGIF